MMYEGEFESKFGKEPTVMMPGTRKYVGKLTQGIKNLNEEKEEYQYLYSDCKRILSDCERKLGTSEEKLREREKELLFSARKYKEMKKSFDNILKEKGEIKNKLTRERRANHETIKDRDYLQKKIFYLAKKNNDNKDDVIEIINLPCKLKVDGHEILVSYSNKAVRVANCPQIERGRIFLRDFTKEKKYDLSETRIKTYILNLRDAILYGNDFYELNSKMILDPFVDKDFLEMHEFSNEEEKKWESK
jgi:hypothetical protein